MNLHILRHQLTRGKAIRVKSKNEFDCVCAVLNWAFGLIKPKDIPLDAPIDIAFLSISNDSHIKVRRAWVHEDIISFSVFAEITEEVRNLNIPTPDSLMEAVKNTVYNGVFVFGSLGVKCIIGNRALWYNKPIKEWGVEHIIPNTMPHRLVPVKEFTVGKWYACGGEQLNTPLGYSMYLGYGKFIAWTAGKSSPLWIYESAEGAGAQLIEVTKAS